MPGLCGAGGGTQGFMLSRQALYWHNHIPSLFKAHLNLIKHPLPLCYLTPRCHASRLNRLLDLILPSPGRRLHSSHTVWRAWNKAGLPIQEPPGVSHHTCGKQELPSQPRSLWNCSTSHFQLPSSPPIWAHHSFPGSHQPVSMSNWSVTFQSPLPECLPSGSPMSF